MGAVILSWVERVVATDQGVKQRIAATFEMLDTSDAITLSHGAMQCTYLLSCPGQSTVLHRPMLTQSKSRP